METKFLNELYEMVEELKKDNNKKQLLIKYKEFLPKLVSSIYPINCINIFLFYPYTSFANPYFISLL